MAGGQKLDGPKSRPNKRQSYPHTALPLEPARQPAPPAPSSPRPCGKHVYFFLSPVDTQNHHWRAWKQEAGTQQRAGEQQRPAICRNTQSTAHLALLGSCPGRRRGLLREDTGRRGKEAGERRRKDGEGGGRAEMCKGTETKKTKKTHLGAADGVAGLAALQQLCARPVACV